MKLGNYKGRNKGKKYLKITGGEIVTDDNQTEANNFARWFAANFDLLQRELVAKNTVDNDQVNNTYLRIYDNIYYGGLRIGDYKAYFHRAFFTNYVQHSIRQSKDQCLFVPDDKAIEIATDDDDKEADQRRKELCDEAISFIKECYPPHTCEVFFAYLSIGERSYEPVCLKTGLERNEVVKIINKVRERVRNNKQLMSKRRSMRAGSPSYNTNR